MKVLYFAQLKENIGRDQDVIDLKKEISVKVLIQQLIKKMKKI